MALLGWNPGTEEELFTLDGLIEKFSLGRVQKGGAIFNIERLDWMNGEYIRDMSIDELTEKCVPYLMEDKLIEPAKESRIKNQESRIRNNKFQASFKFQETNEIVTFEWLKKVIALEQERMNKLSEIGELTEFFFKDKLRYSKELLRWKKMSDKEIKDNLDELIKILSSIESFGFDRGKIENILMPVSEKRGKGELLWPLRVALTGRKASPGPFEIMGVLGKEKTLKRLKEARKKI